ncbi:MAG: SdrD B-like domain-containing protein, partial [Caldilineaceae bacterium]
ARPNAGTTNGNCWFNDTNAFDRVGKVGFGDLDIADDFSTLYTVNLADNTLLSIPIANPAGTTTFALPTPTNCPAVDLRPFGVGVKDGKVYVGMVCSAESTSNRNALRAYVYSFAGGAFSATPVIEIDLTYNRGSDNLQWQYWLNRTTFNKSDTIQKTGKWGQPSLADIVFDGDTMILGLRDRNADQFGTVAGGPDPADSASYTAFSRGDILRACANGNGGWQLETNGSCGGVTTPGAGNGQGPGGGEYYSNDQQSAPNHSETTLGGHLQIPGLPDVVSLVYNPIEGLANDARSDAGVKWYNNQTGAVTRSYLLYDGSGNTEIAFFDKANGLGDLEALCPAAPLEIGNRVWRDTDGDGVQDPGETGLDGVTVELYRDGVLVGTTTTANGGQYLFNESNVNLNGAGGIAAGLCGPNGAAIYEVRIPNATGGAQQLPLAGLALTQANNGGATNGTLRDSNGALVGTGAVYAIPCSDLSAPGFNNHTYDFGFTPAPVAATHSLGNYVWIDANNDGLVTVGEVAVPNGVVVELLAADGTPTGQTTTTANGFYLFSGLTAGSYRVRVAASNFQVGGLLASYTSSTGPGQEVNPDANGDQNDNGLDSGAPATDGIVSAVITLGRDEPTGESPTASGTPGNDGAGTADADSNLTVDFGVVPPPVERVAIGNVVFRDLNNNGRIDGSESGIDGVQVTLLPAGADPLTTAPLATATTSGGGFYLFDNLTPGQYFVYLTSSNFRSGGVLAGYLSSTGNGTSDSADDNADENGIDGPDLATNGVRSIVYDLQPNSEPTGESGAGLYGGALDDNNVNMTADFGVYLPLCLGNRVWRDDGAGGGTANNGVFDGAEQGIANVVVRLLDGAGNPVLGANGQPLTATTDAQGYYFFCNLLPGSYIVLIEASNFAVGGPLSGLDSSGPTEGTPDSDGDMNDNGINVPNPAATGIRSGVVTLAYNNEPTNESDLGPVGTGQVPNSNNLTVDFGFFRQPTNEEEAQEPTALRRLYLPLALK